MSTSGGIQQDQNAASKFFGAAADSKLDEIMKALNDNSESAKLDAMKRLVAMLSKGRDVSTMFPHVVKNVITQNLELKKLVFFFLNHYTEFEPEIALLAINSIQKDLDNPNQLIRAQALRAMSNIRLPVILQIVVLAIKKSSVDGSAYVRRAAAHAIPKVYSFVFFLFSFGFLIINHLI